MAIISTLWGDWVWFAGAALMLTTVLVAIVYALSELFMDNKMKSWAKMELAEIFYSAIIISIGISGLPIIDAVVQSSLGVSNIGTAPTVVSTSPASWSVMSCTDPGTGYFIQTIDTGHSTGNKTYRCLDICGSTIAQDSASVYHGIESCHMRLGVWYLREIFDETKTFAFDVYLSYIKTSMLAEFTINIEFIYEKAGFFTFTPWRGFFTIGNKIKEMSFDWAMKLMMLTKFQEVLLSFVAKAMFPAFFVIGALLRVFPFTRKLGGLMLAIAIALYFIFPAFYAFGALVMLDIKKDYDVRSTWFSSNANPANRWSTSVESPYLYPDPPIANTMYLHQNMSMVGKGGNFDSSIAQSQLRGMEGTSAEDYFAAMESGALDGSALTPSFDLSKADTRTNAQKDADMEAAYTEANNWFLTVSQENKVDDFPTLAYEPNGPLDTLSRLTFWSIFFALFSILATIAGIRSLSITFGGDIEIAGLTRLI